MAASKSPTPRELLSARSALIILIAVVIGLVIGGLTLWATASPAKALLAGLFAAGAAVVALNQLIGN